MESAFSLALLTGLLGGFGHCIGMCGPIVASQAVSRGVGSSGMGARVIVGLQYHAGRLFTYAAIGAAMGLSGSFANTAGGIAGIQNVAALLAGLVMIAMGLSISGLWRGIALIERHNGTVLALAGKAMSSTSALRTIFLGLVMGLLPCGLSYTAFIASAGAGSAFKGMMVALLLGVGTLPALLFFGTLVASLGASKRRWITRIGGIVVILMGLWYLVRGISLYARV
ncbi:MAG: sulfite exporter TauE/SafE family protein [Spirochaetota bacterium]